MSSFFGNLFSALCKRARSRSAAPRPRRTTLCILPLEDRITPSAVGGWDLSNLPAPSDPAAATTTNRVIFFKSNTPNTLQNGVDGGVEELIIASPNSGHIKVVSGGAIVDLIVDPINRDTIYHHRVDLEDISLRLISPGVDGPAQAAGANAFDGRFLTARDLSGEQSSRPTFMPFGNFAGGVSVGSAAHGTGGGGGDIVVFDIVDSVARGSSRWEQVIIGDLPDATDHAANSDVEWKYVPIRRMANAVGDRTGDDELIITGPPVSHVKVFSKSVAPLASVPQPGAHAGGGGGAGKVQMRDFSFTMKVAKARAELDLALNNGSTLDEQAGAAASSDGPVIHKATPKLLLAFANGQH